jgi:hypothetical protein
MVRGKTFMAKEPKIGRNETCPCGSGKKHKKCCMFKGQQPMLTVESIKYIKKTTAYLKKRHKRETPNGITKAAIEELENGGGKTSKNIEELFKDLNTPGDKSNDGQQK